uniref:uL3m n=1 Tax=Polytomella magna TaxID=353565 RepID=UPI002240E508|nr:Chain Ab, uL3m [Polytomella magna]8APN_Ab Chain Ab, uL3m [Polytomella magna]8APO_Ab Chain Ab, uL3m [Polytomella magna]
GYRPAKPVYPLPDSIASLVEDKIAELKKFGPTPEPALEPLPLTPDSVRVGCITVKAGMTHEWDEHGVMIPLTVLWIDECQVVGLKYFEKNGYYAVQLGAGCVKQHTVLPQIAGYYLKHDLPIKREMKEYQVSSPEALLPVGTHITAAHFVVGQQVDVTGYTTDKGFQGVMKRWGFKGMPASHGVSLSHRKPGATGGRQDPGKIWKEKKLPGHMGDEKRTQLGLELYKVDPKRNLLYVKGAVPGPRGASILVRDSNRMDYEERVALNLPYPTFIGSPDELPVLVRKSDKDPYLMYKKEIDYFPIKWK